MKKAFKFVLISGIGFIIDFVIYNILTLLFNINVDLSNMISSMVGVTFVFFTSTKKVFENNTHKISLKVKYLIYIIYQLLLIFLASKVMLVLKNYLVTFDVILLTKYAHVIVKIFITPFTLTINYFVMKYLSNY